MKTKRESVINKKFYKTRVKGLVITKNKLKSNLRKVINNNSVFLKKKTMNFVKTKSITLENVITKNSINFLKKKRNVVSKNTFYRGKKSQKVKKKTFMNRIKKLQKYCDWKKKQPTQSIIEGFNDKKNEKSCEKLGPESCEVTEQKLENSIKLEWYDVINKKSNEEKQKKLQKILYKEIDEIIDQLLNEAIDQESTETIDQESTETIDQESTEIIDQESTETANPESTETANLESTETANPESITSIGLDWYNVINKKSSKDKGIKLQEILDTEISEIIDQFLNKTRDHKSDETIDHESDETIDHELQEVIDQKSSKVITPLVSNTDYKINKNENLELHEDNIKPYPNDKDEVDKIKTTSAVKFLFSISNILVRSEETDINHIKNKLNYNFKSLTKKTSRGMIIPKTKLISKALKNNNIGSLYKHRNTKLKKKSTIGLVGILLRKSHSKILEIAKQEKLETNHNTFSIQNRVGDISMGLNNVSLRIMSMIGVKSPTLLVVNRIKSILARLPKKTSRLVHKTNFIFTILMLILYLDTNILATFVGESFYKTEFGRQRRLFYIFRNAMGPITSACAMYSPIRGIYLGFRGKIATKAGLRKKRLSTRYGIYSSSNFGLQHKYRFKTIWSKNGSIGLKTIITCSPHHREYLSKKPKRVQ